MMTLTVEQYNELADCLKKQCEDMINEIKKCEQPLREFKNKVKNLSESIEKIRIVELKTQKAVKTVLDELKKVHSFLPEIDCDHLIVDVLSPKLQHRLSLLNLISIKDVLHAKTRDILNIRSFGKASFDRLTMYLIMHFEEHHGNK